MRRTSSIAETDVSALPQLQKRMFRHNVRKLFLAETSGSQTVLPPHEAMVIKVRIGVASITQSPLGDTTVKPLIASIIQALRGGSTLAYMSNIQKPH